MVFERGGRVYFSPSEVKFEKKNTSQVQFEITGAYKKEREGNNLFPQKDRTSVLPLTLIRKFVFIAGLIRLHPCKLEDLKPCLLYSDTWLKRTPSKADTLLRRTKNLGPFGQVF